MEFVLRLPIPAMSQPLALPLRQPQSLSPSPATTTTTTSSISNSNGSSSPLPPHLPIALLHIRLHRPISNSTTITATSNNRRRITTPKCSLAPPLRPLSVSDPEIVTSAAAVAAAIRRASSPNSPVEFVHRIDKGGGAGSDLVLPSPDFHRLCLEQLDLFRTVVDPNAVLSVYVRPAGGYVMEQLELRRVAFYPGIGMEDTTERVVIVANFGVTASLRAVEAALSNKQVDVLPDHGAVVLPLVKHPFVMGFLVAEIPFRELEVTENDPNQRSDIVLRTPAQEIGSFLPSSDGQVWEMHAHKNDFDECNQLTAERRSTAVMISRSLAMAYVMDQRAILLQQSSWQNNIRMSHLIEQIRAPLLNIRTLSKMLATHVKKNEISYDVIEDILVQGDQMKESLQQLQDAVHFTKANIMRYNEESLKKLRDSTDGHLELSRSLLPDHHSSKHQEKVKQSVFSSNSAIKDTEMPMPPLALAPQQQHIRPCSVSDVLGDLVGAASPLALKQQRLLEFCEHALPPQVAVEEAALRRALSNLIEGSLLRTKAGGKVQIVASGAPGGDALVVIEDDGPDMHYMTQMHSLTPFGADLLSEDVIEDNMTWNFVASVSVSREILESYGCVVRVKSPRIPDAAPGSGGTCVEVWMPTLEPYSNASFQEA